MSTRAHSYRTVASFLLTVGVFAAGCGTDGTQPRRGNGDAGTADGGARSSGGSASRYSEAGDRDAGNGGEAGYRDGGNGDEAGSRSDSGGAHDAGAGPGSGHADAGAAGTDGGPIGGGAVDPVNLPASTVVAIGPAGGEVELGRARLVIPPGAVDDFRGIELTIRAPNPGEETIVGNVYDFEPDGLVFAKPALLLIDHADGELGVNANELTVVTRSGDAGTWTELESWLTDTGVAAWVPHFTNMGRSKIINVRPQKRRCDGVNCGCQSCDPATGTCQAIPKFGRCEGTRRCIDTTIDHDHCGGCATACSGGEYCEDSKCVCQCPDATGACPDREGETPVLCPASEVPDPRGCGCNCKGHAACNSWHGTVSWTMSGHTMQHSTTDKASGVTETDDSVDNWSGTGSFYTTGLQSNKPPNGLYIKLGNAKYDWSKDLTTVVSPDPPNSACSTTTHEVWTVSGTSNLYDYYYFQVPGVTLTEANDATYAVSLLVPMPAYQSTQNHVQDVMHSGCSPPPTHTENPQSMGAVTLDTISKLEIQDVPILNSVLVGAKTVQASGLTYEIHWRLTQ